jgi:hypothetical protein
MAKRDFKGIWIPKEIWLSESLTLQEKVFLVEIHSLDNEDGCFASNDYFARFFGVSKRRASEVINALHLKGYLSILIDKEAGNTRTIRTIEEKFHTLEKETARGYSRKVPDPIEESCYHNNTVNNTANNTTKEKASPPCDKDVRGGIEKPTASAYPGEIKKAAGVDSPDVKAKEKIPLPHGPAFALAWIEWEQYRKEKKETLTPTTTKRQLKKLATYPEAIAIAMLNNSMDNGWTGLFELKAGDKAKAAPQPKQKRSDFIH